MTTTYPALFLFAGLGGGALGFQRAQGRMRGLVGRFRIAGAVDFDAAAARDFEALTGHPCTVADLATMTPDELRAACPEPPALVFLSAPCKGFSGCLPTATSCTPKYQEMNTLAVRGLWLTLETWPNDPPRLFLFENVPRIQNRGRHLLDVVVGMLQSYGYACRETVHDCGELGGLGQRRRRFLLVARHTRSVPNYWFEPPKKALRTVGDVIGQLPVPWPGGDGGGPMHRLPRLSALNWLRLALVPAGGDWRNLPPSVEMRASDDRHRGAYGVERWDDAGHAVVAAANHRNAWSSVADPRLPPREQRQNGGFGVEDWTAPGHAVVAEGSVRNTRAAVADPRVPCGPRNGAYGVTGFDEPSGTVLAAAVHDNGPFSVADPRLPTRDDRHKGKLGVDGWDSPGHTVIASSSPHLGPGSAVADPRPTCAVREGAYGVTRWDRTSTTVIAAPSPHNGPWQVADPRPEHACRRGSYGVQDDGAPAPTVIGESNAFHGQNVRDPRGASRGVLWIDRESGALVGPAEVLARFDVADKRPMADPPIIIAADGTWHRPMTTLELAALQGLPVGREGDWLVLDGASHRDWRQRVGNAVPAPTAEAIAETAIRALLAADDGVWELGGEGVWVREEKQEAAA